MRRAICSPEGQRLEKILQDAGIKLSSVASGTWSQAARAMVTALIAGERDPAVLAGRLSLKAIPWTVPGGAVHFTPTRFPRSIAEATAED